MAKIGDDYAKLLEAMIPGGNWANGSGKGIDGKRRVVKGEDKVSETDINELRDAFYNFATIAGAGIDTSTPALSFKTAINLGKLITVPNWCVQNGFLQTQNRSNNSLAHEDWNHNFVDVYPPFGYSINNCILFACSLGAVYFQGTTPAYHRDIVHEKHEIGVREGHSTYCYWKRINDVNSFGVPINQRFRIICNNNYNRSESCVSFLAIWSMF